MENLVPVVYLAFANELDDHLAELKNESRAIFKALHGLEKEGKIRVHREESSQVDELHQDLLAYDQDIVIFHYGGHADGGMLQLEGGRGSASGLAKMLGQQKSLKLVFLNGCATKDQVKLLHSAGVPAVIATSVKINDSKATIFSTAFYESMAKGHSIEDSFESAGNLLETKFSENDIFDISFNRFPEWEDEEELEPEGDAHEGLEWALYTRADADTDIKQWRLTSAQTEWQVQLRDAQGVIRSAIDDEPLLITHRSVQRNLSAGVCTQCGTTLLRAKKGERDSNTCPLCLNEKLEKGAAATSLPDRIIDFSISQKQASSISSQAFQALFTKSQKPSDLAIESPVPIWAPYWKFDASVVAEYEGESAFPTMTKGKSELDWRSGGERFDTPLDGFLVPASRTPVVTADDDELDMRSAREYDPKDSLELSLPTDKNIEEAFLEASNDVSSYLDVEIKKRLGGVEQRSIKSKTRYDNLAASLVWLPRWLVSAKFQGNTSALIVDGQTGSVDMPRVKGVSQINDEVKNIMDRKTFSLGSDTSKANLLASVFGGIGIGLMVGLLMGLAAPSEPGEQKTVSIFIGAVGVILAALLGLNDRHFSIAKGLRIGSFGFAVCVAALGGIYLRANGVLSPDAGVTALYDKRPLAVGEKDGEASREAKSKGDTLQPFQITALFADEINLDTCSELQNSYEDELPADVLINNFKLMEGTGWDIFAKSVEDNIDQPHQKTSLLLVRDVMCNAGEFNNPDGLDKSACKTLQSAVRSNDYDVIQTSFGPYQIAPVLDHINSRMDEKNGIATLGLMLEMMCANPVDK